MITLPRVVAAAAALFTALFMMLTRSSSAPFTPPLNNAQKQEESLEQVDVLTRHQDPINHAQGHTAGDLCRVFDPFGSFIFQGKRYDQRDRPATGYAQLGQDALIAQVYAGRDTHGYTYLDLAAAWSGFQSNTYLLDACLGWRGVCIEPDRAKAETLEDDRSCELVEMCVAPTRKTISFASRFRSGRNNMQTKGGAMLVRTCDRLDEVVRNTPMGAAGRTRFDLMSLDIEGGEADALESAGALVFDVLVMETHYLTNAGAGDASLDPVRERLVRWLDANGYVPIVGIPVARRCGSEDPVYGVSNRDIFFEEGGALAAVDRKGLHDVFFVRSDSQHLPIWRHWRENVFCKGG